MRAVIGAAMLACRTARPALIASIACAPAVWAVGEGFGEVLAGMDSVITGGPGAALIYAVLAAAMLGGGNGHDAGANGRSPDWVPVAWSAVWLLLLFTGPWPGQAAPSALDRQFTGAATSLPAIVARALAKAGTIASGYTLPLVVVLVLSETAIALGALRPGQPGSGGSHGNGVAQLTWPSGQALGGIFGGRATDLGTGPPMTLLAVAVWGAARHSHCAAAC